MAQKTITINGRLYDAITGLPVAGEAPKAAPKTAAPIKKEAPAKKVVKKTPVVARTKAESTSVHASPLQRTQTLRGRVAKKPATPAKAGSLRPTPGRHMDISRSSSISKFAPHPVKKAAPVAAAATPRKAVSAPTAAPAKKATSADRPAVTHPSAKRAVAAVAARKQPVVKKPATAKEVKETQIKAALETPKAKPAKKKVLARKWPRRLVIVGSIAAIIIGGLFIVYRFVPSVSVGIAAAQADVNASYPEYTPDGYALSHPVTYSDGEVALKFTSNSNENFYTIIQTRSSWESSAVLDNVVKPKAGEDYSTTKERGLTIYSFGNNVAWINKGVLYKIEGNAALSGDQIRKIATSL